ncbi:iron uptake transporter permease EfeU [Nocardioides sp.]|uniref:iron uptake transporter permease EfeU n=1 Tax=Nocardioides sp. TaxID=35761 RepID=UPI0039E45628
MIGLREGLEAVLIVTIVATFLRHNNASLRGMWLGVAAGVGVSVAVGVALNALEQSLPQARQEALETVIGAVAVFFVTGMVLWMRKHARTMRRELETQAAEALRSGTTTALAMMAFLAVLREGFETSVFLLATFQHATSAPAAVSGAALGIVAAIVLGWAMFAGGVRLNLQRFFTVTGVFLVFVAAGLVLSAFRTAHEAGWVTVGQQRTVDLGWLTPNGTVRSALVTGVLGMPADPRVIELLAWACYLAPMLLLMFWPARLRPGPALAQRLRLAGAAVAVLGAVALATLVHLPQPKVPTSGPLEGGGTLSVSVDGTDAAIETADQTFALTSHEATDEAGADTRWTATKAAALLVGQSLPATVDLQTLLDYNGGRIPNGLSVATAPGPYDATWTDDTELTVLTRDGGLVDAQLTGTLLLSYGGGGLTTPRVMTIEGWQLDPSYVQATRSAITAADAEAHDRLLWTRWVPVFLLLLAATLLVRTLRLRSGRASHAPGGTKAGTVPAPETEGTPLR